ncbi:MAG: DUF4905 domain-containing protein [Bacteroidetes bacterium]|nr:DUF4905 domain-containing protein [Bacteroidota bacterium]MBU2505204.1 DUF4905 domain-containing protein [Bacteroidota bacterium]
MKLKKSCSYKTKYQVWRILISAPDKIFIETRDTENKQVFFNCQDISSGKFLLKNFQHDEKYWIGIETVWRNYVIFHKYAKPDMPGHKSIILFDIKSKKNIWQNNELTFLFHTNDLIYAYQTTFSGRKFYSLSVLAGETLEDFGDDYSKINSFQEQTQRNEDYSDYTFPESYFSQDSANTNIDAIIEKINAENNLVGEIEYISKGDLFLFNYHVEKTTGNLENVFVVYNSSKSKIIFSETINKNINAIIPDSFFVYKNLLILLKNKNEVSVFEII